MTETERTRAIAVARVVLLAVEAYQPPESVPDGTHPLTDLIVAYGRGLGVTAEEADTALITEPIRLARRP